MPSGIFNKINVRTITGFFALLLAPVILATNNIHTVSASATPESCFGFISSSGTINAYRETEGGVVGATPCPREVVIPGSIDGVTVTTIGNNAFIYKSLESVVLPDSITAVGDYAFYENYLTQITLSPNLASIGNYAFSNNRLTYAKVPASVSAINGSAFSHNLISEFVVEGNPASIGSYILYYNPVDKITYNGNTYTSDQSISEACYAVNAQGVITDFAYASLAKIKQASSACLNHNIIIPGEINGVAVTGIGQGSFYSSYLESVVIPNGVKFIDQRAFMRNNLTTLVIPDGVERIEWYAFNLNKLEKVKIPNSLTFIENNAFFLQNKWGGSVWYSVDPDVPDMWSEDPVQLNNLYDNTWFVQLITADPSNPAGIQDSNINESWEIGDDKNQDGIDNSIGGHIVNPARVTMSYKSKDGSPLIGQRTFTGYNDGDYLTSYSVRLVAEIPSPVRVANPTAEEQEVINDGLSLFWRVGDSHTFNVPNIAGYVAEGYGSTYTLVFSSTETNAEVLYTPTRVTDGAQGGERLAETGVSIKTMFGISVVVVLIGFAVFVKRI